MKEDIVKIQLQIFIENKLALISHVYLRKKVVSAST